MYVRRHIQFLSGLGAPIRIPSRKLITLGVTVAFLASGVQASTGLPNYYGWLILSMYILIPILLLIPVVAIALTRLRGQTARILWAISTAVVGMVSYGSLWWAYNEYTLGATESWPTIYLWLLPSYALWFAFHKLARMRPTNR